MNPTSPLSNPSSSPPPKSRLWGLAIVLGFLLLAWGLWWYFDYKIQSLDGTLPP